MLNGIKRILLGDITCFNFSTCSVIQVGSMLSSQHLNKVMAEVCINNNNNNT